MTASAKMLIFGLCGPFRHPVKTTVGVRQGCRADSSTGRFRAVLGIVPNTDGAPQVYDPRGVWLVADFYESLQLRIFADKLGSR